jgi:hypothetical protein
MLFYSVLHAQAKGEIGMLWTLVIILLILWLLGMVSSYTLGGLVHILLVIALVVIVIRLIQGRRAL